MNNFRKRRKSKLKGEIARNMVYSIIKKSQLEGAKRVDAECYQYEYLEMRKKLSSLKNYVILGDISKKFMKGIFDIKAETYSKHGIPFIRISNLKNALIDKNEIVYISTEANKKEKSSSLNKGDLVLSKTAYPAASLITDEIVNISQDIIGISLKDEWLDKIKSQYIVAFLNSKYGKLEMMQWFQGNIQMHLALPDAKTIIIPLPNKTFQHEIENIFISIEQKITEANSFYHLAENLFLEELGLIDFKFKDSLFFIVDSSKTKERLDADYFQPKYHQLVELLKNKNSKPLLEVIGNIEPDFDPIKEPEKKFKYVELANINQSLGIIDGFNEVLGKEAPNRARRLLKENDVIVSSVEGSLNKVALVRGEQKDYLASTGFFQFRSKKILPEVLLVMSKSIVIQMQLKKHSAGTILTAVPKDSIRDLIVPILQDSTQQKIVDLVKKSHEAREESKKLLEEAKRKVEEMIEKGGE